jgi:hypothetical protein
MALIPHLIRLSGFAPSDFQSIDSTIDSEIEFVTSEKVKDIDCKSGSACSLQNLTSLFVQRFAPGQRRYGAVFRHGFQP